MYISNGHVLRWAEAIYRQDTGVTLINPPMNEYFLWSELPATQNPTNSMTTLHPQSNPLSSPGSPVNLDRKRQSISLRKFTKKKHSWTIVDPKHNLTLMEDNAPVHTTCVSRKFLESNNIKTNVGEPNLQT